MSDDEDLKVENVPRRIVKTECARHGWQSHGTIKPHLIQGINNSTLLSPENFRHSLIKRTQSQTLESPFLPTDLNHYRPGTQPMGEHIGSAKVVPVNSVRTESRCLRRSESEFVFSRAFSKAPGTCIVQTDSRSVAENPLLLSRPDSPTHYEGPTHCPRNLTATRSQQCDSGFIQTGRSLLEERFLLMESILLGCDLVNGMEVNHEAVLSEIKMYAKWIREKTVQSKVRNSCTRYGQEESQILIEYLKIFCMISDTWLDARSCFGSTDQCLNEICSLFSRDLANTYMNWMHATRQLLTSITSGLENALKISTNHRNISQNSYRQPGFPSELHQHCATFSHRPSYDLPNCDGFWGYTANASCNCQSQLKCMEFHNQSQLQSATEGRFTQTDSQVWANGQPIPPNLGNSRLYSSVEDGYGNGDYLEPSSYDVPRSKMTPSQIIFNTSKAKSHCFQVKEGVCAEYVIILPNNTNKRDKVSLLTDRKCSDGCSNMGDANEDYYSKDNNLAELNQTIKSEGWLLSLLKANKKDNDIASSHKMGVVDTIDEKNDKEDECGSLQLDSDSPISIEEQGEDTYEKKSKAKVKKCGKALWQPLQRRKLLSQYNISRVQEIIQELWNIDLPDYAKYPIKTNQFSDYYKVVKHPIFLETITNKCKNGVYETPEQFVHDCRRLILNTATYSQENVAERGKTYHFSSKFESLLEKYFDRSHDWKHISGDPKDITINPELRYADPARKRTRMPKIAINDEPGEN